MSDIDTQRKVLNKAQTQLRELMTDKERPEQAIEPFLNHHAMLHAAKMADAGLWSFEDAILGDMDEARIRRIPSGSENSIAWCFWHIARIEDVAMNRLIADQPQIFLQGNWQKRMQISFVDTGNAMSAEEMVQLSEEINIAALRVYRVAVGRQTRQIVTAITPTDFTKKVDLQRLEQIRADDAIREGAEGILEYWRKRTIAGLLLMPASRHILVHLNEALNLKRKR